MKARIWFMEEDRYGATDRKFSVDFPSFIPRVGEFIDADEASGWVNHVQYNFGKYSEFDAIVHVLLSKEKP